MGASVPLVSTSFHIQITSLYTHPHKKITFKVNLDLITCRLVETEDTVDVSPQYTVETMETVKIAEKNEMVETVQLY